MGVMPLPVDEGPEPRTRPSRAIRVTVVALVLAAIAVGGWSAVRTYRARAIATAKQPSGVPGASAPDPTTDSLARAPAGARIKVQVVNATRVRGLARRATQALRDRGYDVVEVGTTGQLRDTTLILDRSGHPQWAQRAARAIGGARIETRPDSSHYLDLTVLVGRTWHAAAEPFYP